MNSNELLEMYPEGVKNDSQIEKWLLLYGDKPIRKEVTVYGNEYFIGDLKVANEVNGIELVHKGKRFW